MASYPLTIKNFAAKQDLQDINYAEDIDDIQNEILAIETTLGVNPYANLPYTSLNAALTDLYQNKAVAAHTHAHSALTGDATGNDHPQYALLSGATFTGPVTAPPAQTGGQLATLGQLQSQGIADITAVQSAINTQLQYRCQGAPSASVGLLGNATTFGYTQIGGYNEGCTDSIGQIACVFGGAFKSVVQTFTAMKANIGLGPPVFLPCSGYNPNTTLQPLLVTVSINRATVQFVDKPSGNPLNNVHVAFSWSAMGL